MATQLTFVAACKKVFEKKEGQTSLDFIKELKELDADDRKELKELFLKECDIEVISS